VASQAHFGGKCIDAGCKDDLRVLGKKNKDKTAQIDRFEGVTIASDSEIRICRLRRYFN
jgi:hypothetical protein